MTLVCVIFAKISNHVIKSKNQCRLPNCNESKGHRRKSCIN
jgi:hypothetical protein